MFILHALTGCYQLSCEPSKLNIFQNSNTVQNCWFSCVDETMLEDKNDNKQAESGPARKEKKKA